MSSDERSREEPRRRDAARAEGAERSRGSARAQRAAGTRMRGGGKAVVSVIMGSDSDYDVMGAAADALTEFGIAHEVRVVSAHRTPLGMAKYAQEAAGRGIKVIIAGAGGAAHLPGMVASLTALPVIGVPVPLKYLDGMDSLLSIVQMPAGVPVATVSIGGARNAGLLAVRILATADPELADRMTAFQAQLADAAAAKDAALAERLGQA
jgi:5-(carboxyamino)imidazole ribonucleotide mutase